MACVLCHRAPGGGLAFLGLPGADPCQCLRGLIYLSSWFSWMVLVVPKPWPSRPGTSPKPPGSLPVLAGSPTVALPCEMGPWTVDSAIVYLARYCFVVDWCFLPGASVPRSQPAGEQSAQVSSSGPSQAKGSATAPERIWHTRTWNKSTMSTYVVLLVLKHRQTTDFTRQEHLHASNTCHCHPMFVPTPWRGGVRQPILTALCPPCM